MVRGADNGRFRGRKVTLIMTISLHADAEGVMAKCMIDLGTIAG
jgi:hypothetical protein